jgi:hypothetical protein
MEIMYACPEFRRKYDDVFNFKKNLQNYYYMALNGVD